MARASAVAAVLAIVGLLLPWAGSGTRARSTIELLAVAGALELIEPWQRVLLLGIWMAVVVSAAVGLCLITSGRMGAGASCLVPIGPVLAIALVVIARSSLTLEWGAVMATGWGVVASVGGLAVLGNVRTEEARRDAE